MKEIYFYWLPNCPTCQKAKRRLDYHRVSVTKFRAENEMLDLTTTDYTFLKRPVLVTNNKAIAGFFEKFFDEFMKGVKKELKIF